MNRLLHVLAVHLLMGFIISNYVYSLPSIIKTQESEKTKTSDGEPRQIQTRNLFNFTWNLPGQSPINITKSNSFFFFIPKLVLNLYDSNISPMKLTNNGETVVLYFPKNYSADQTPYLSGSSFPTNYRFVQLHFHWGPDSVEGGSEHLLRSKRYAAEMHLVHYNTKYNSFTEATAHSDGLAVLGVLMDTNNNPNDHPGIEKLVSEFSKLKESGSETNMTSTLNLKELLPTNTQNFYRYQGSLTTPKYAEIVTWTVLKSPISVSEKQVAAFRTLLHEDGKPITKNYREAQDIGRRRVLFNWRPFSNIFG